MTFHAGFQNLASSPGQYIVIDTYSHLLFYRDLKRFSKAKSDNLISYKSEKNMPLSQTPQNIFSRLYRMGIWDICELVLEILCFTVHAISLSLNTSVSNSWRNLLQLDHLNFITSITICIP